MKSAIVGPSEELKRLVLFTQQLSDSVEVQSLNEIIKDKKIEVILTEQKDLTPGDIIQIRQQFYDHKILILVDEIEPFFEKSCIAHDVLLLSKEMTEREQLDLIQKAWFGLEEQTEYHNVIAIHGTHRQVGVTQIALSLGHTLGVFNLKTLVIGLNPYNPGELPTIQSTYSFDQVYDLIQSNVINSAESLLPYLSEQNGFHYLVGNRDFYKAVQFESKPVERLIQFAKEHFQIVILDVGSFYDSFLPLVGLQMSNTHILVSSQEYISLEEYKRWKEQVLNRFEFYPKSNFQVVNKFASKAILTPKQLEDKHGVPVLAQVPFFPEANDAEIDDGILSMAAYTPYVRVIEGLAKTITADVLQYQTSTKKGLFHFFTGGKN